MLAPVKQGKPKKSLSPRIMKKASPRPTKNVDLPLSRNSILSKTPVQTKVVHINLKSESTDSIISQSSETNPDHNLYLKAFGSSRVNQTQSASVLELYTSPSKRNTNLVSTMS